jgi:hypothetical protein
MRQPFVPDLLIEDIQGKPIAVVEVKAQRNLTIDDATEIRHSMLDRGLPGQIPYFLLLSQDVGYLWKGAQLIDPDAPPGYEFPMGKVIARYENDPDRRIYESELSLLMLQWLTHLSTKALKATEEPEKTLAQAGFNDSIRNGLVFIEEPL